MDAAGNWIPVADEAQLSLAPPAEVSERPFHVGEAVYLTGRVVEVQHPQGGHTSVKVQLPQGAVWLRSNHLTHSEPLERLAESGSALEEIEAEEIVEPEAQQDAKALSAPPDNKAVTAPTETK